MNITANRARCLSQILLLSALFNHGVLQAHDLGTGQQTSGMLRLGRDLMRRTGSIAIDERPAARAGFSSSAEGRYLRQSLGF
jgi:hypothetical protein